MNLFSSLAGALHPLVDLLFPRVCAVCGNSLVEGEKYICSACLSDFPFTERSCGTEDVILGMYSPLIRPRQLYSLFYYSKYSDYRRLVYAVKYHSHQKLAQYLGRMLGERIPPDCGIDGIIPVPLHPRRERQRGFNQAFQIALGVQEVTGLEIYSGVLDRIKNNVTQTGKNTGERRENVKNIFKLRDPKQIAGKHILLVDDVITTGATLGACMLALETAGNVSFSLACVAQAADI